MVDAGKCGGCRTCELICSWVHNAGVIRPAVSRIHVSKDEIRGIYAPLVCRQCASPRCEEVCPEHAVRRDDKTGAVLIDEETCTGCKLCFEACPLGAVRIDPEKNIMIKCDLCGGDPQCVKWCANGALIYENAEIAGLSKKKPILNGFLKK